jgi:hypothetical protein
MINDTLKANSPYINVSYDECVMGSVGYYKCMARGSTQSLDKPTFLSGIPWSSRCSMLLGIVIVFLIDCIFN